MTCCGSRGGSLLRTCVTQPGKLADEAHDLARESRLAGQGPRPAYRAIEAVDSLFLRSANASRSHMIVERLQLNGRAVRRLRFRGESTKKLYLMLAIIGSADELIC